MTDGIVLERSPTDWRPQTVELTSSASEATFTPVAGALPLRKTVYVENAGTSPCYLAAIAKPQSNEVYVLEPGNDISIDTEGGVWAAMASLSDATTLRVIETYTKVLGGGPVRVQTIIDPLSA